MSATMRTVLIVTVAVVALPLLWGSTMMGGWMAGGMGPGMMWGAQGSDGWWRWGGLLMLLPGVLIVGGIVAAVVWGIGNSAEPQNPAGPSNAREILDARYARGEITRDEYQQMRRDVEA